MKSKRFIIYEIIIILVAIAAILLPQIMGTVEVSAENGEITYLADLSDKAFAVVADTEESSVTASVFPDCETIPAADIAEAADYVSDGTAFATIMALSDVRNVLVNYPTLTAFPNYIAEENEIQYYVVLREADLTFKVCDEKISDLDTAGKKVAYISGCEKEQQIEERFPGAELVPCTNTSDVYYSVETGKADYGISYMDYVQELSKTYPDFEFFYESYLTLRYSFVTQLNDDGAKLRDEFDEFYDTIRANGWYNSMVAKYTSDTNNALPYDYTYTGENGKLNVVTLGGWTPMTYYIGEQLTGEFVDLVCCFCQEYGYIPVFYVTDFSSEITGLLSGTYDIVCDAVTITDERLEKVNFTTPLVQSDLLVFRVSDSEASSVAVKKVSKASNFISSLKLSFEKNFIRESRWKMLLSGLETTVLLSVISIIIGTLVGIVICTASMSRSSFLNAFANVYIKLFQALPIVVSLMLIFYIVLAGTEVSPFWACIIGFSLDFGAYSSEIFRNGMEAVPTGQYKAAKALGFGRWKAFRKIILPQALVHILPVFSGQVISTVKMTAVAGYITVQDLTKISDIIRSRTYEAFFPLITTALIYFIIAALLVRILRFVEKKTNPAFRQRKIKGIKE